MNATLKGKSKKRAMQHRSERRFNSGSPAAKTQEQNQALNVTHSQRFVTSRQDIEIIRMKMQKIIVERY
jgi:hypothetical protein